MKADPDSEPLAESLAGPPPPPWATRSSSATIGPPRGSAGRPRHPPGCTGAAAGTSMPAEATPWRRRGGRDGDSWFCCHPNWEWATLNAVESHLTEPDVGPSDERVWKTSDGRDEVLRGWEDGGGDKARLAWGSCRTRLREGQWLRPEHWQRDSTVADRQALNHLCITVNLRNLFRPSWPTF